MQINTERLHAGYLSVTFRDGDTVGDHTYRGPTMTIEKTLAGNEFKRIAAGLAMKAIPGAVMGDG